MQGNAQEIYNAISYNYDALDEANSVIVGDDIASPNNILTVSEASAIQGIPGYDTSNSHYQIIGTADEFISVGDAVLNVSGVDIATAESGYVSASEGELLTNLDANVYFDILDSANAIAHEIIGAGNANELDDAGQVFVSGGVVNVDEAAAIQSISGYLGPMESNLTHYDVLDDATNVLNADPNTLEDPNNVTATNVTSKEDALRLISDGNVDNFTLAPDLANASSITGVTIDDGRVVTK